MKTYANAELSTDNIEVVTHESVLHRLAGLWRADFLSPRDFVRRALTISVLFLLVHLAGLKEFTSVLNGTSGSGEMSRGLASFLGLTYVFAYLGFVLLAPMLLIAAALLAGSRRIFRCPGST